MRTTTVVGTVTRMTERDLALVVEQGNRQHIYTLIPHERAEEVLRQAGGDTARAVVIGKVDSTGARGLMQVQSAWLLQAVGTDATGEAAGP